MSSRDTITLELPQAEYEALARGADGRGKMCSVSKRLLSRLIVDHTRLQTACKNLGIEIIEGKV
jgi:hypothetical protein